MGAQQGATSASPLMVTRMIHGFQGPFVFITPPRQLAVASSQLRATQAHSGQNERKEFQEESFFGTRGNKGAWFGYKEEKLKPGRRLLFPLWLGFRGGQGFIICQSLGKIGITNTGMSKVRSLFKHPFLSFRFRLLIPPTHLRLLQNYTKL